MNIPNKADTIRLQLPQLRLAEHVEYCYVVQEPRGRLFCPHDFEGTPFRVMEARVPNASGEGDSGHLPDRVRVQCLLRDGSWQSLPRSMVRLSSFHAVSERRNVTVAEAILQVVKILTSRRFDACHGHDGKLEPGLPRDRDVEGQKG